MKIREHIHVEVMRCSGHRCDDFNIFVVPADLVGNSDNEHFDSLRSQIIRLSGGFILVHPRWDTIRYQERYINDIRSGLIAEERRCYPQTGCRICLSTCKWKSPNGRQELLGRVVPVEVEEDLRCITESDRSHAGLRLTDIEVFEEVVEESKNIPDPGIRVGKNYAR